MRTALLSILALLLAPACQAITPLTAEACRAMKTEPMRRQCLLSAADAPPSITGKTYSTTDVRPRGPAAIEIPPPEASVAPYVNITPNQRSGGRLP